MSLYTRMMNSNMAVTVNEAAYGHEEGAVAIAMESAQELYEIFRESTYAAEQAEIEAVAEGVVLEGSQYEAVIENAVKSGVDKIKLFLQKLWAKVKAFFANVIRFMDGIVKSGKDFATKYESQLVALKLDGFKYKLFKYDNAAIDSDVKDFGAGVDGIVGVAKKTTQDIVAAYTNRSEDNIEGDKIKAVLDSCKEDFDAMYKKFCKDIIGTEEKDDFEDKIFASYRNGAKSADDKEEQAINIRDIIKVLKDSKADNIKKIQAKSDEGFKKAIKFVEDKAKEMDKAKGNVATTTASILRDFSGTVSKMQSVMNSSISGLKSAFTERNNEYKKVCLAAFRYKKED